MIQIWPPSIYALLAGPSTFYSVMSSWAASYPTVHRSLAPEYQGMSQEQIEEVVEGIFGAGTTLEMAEGFFDGVSNALSGVGRAVNGVAQQAAPYLGRALPGVASGAATGTALGPWGALAGGLVGGLSSALSAPSRPSGPATPRPSAPGGSPSAQPGGLTAGFVPPQQATGSAGAARSNSAIFQLVNALGSPTVQRGVTSMLMGNAGSPTVPSANGNPIPLAAISNLLSMLASRASAEWEEQSPYAGEDYLEAYVDESFDTASEEDRAEWLYGQLASPLPQPVSVLAPEGAYEEVWLDDMYDEMEAAYYRDDG
ncbi:hypothetical protein [Arthrobacter sp. HLT1-20]